MNENLNLVEILKGCPKGTRFYSPMYGEVAFDSIREAPYEVAFMTKRKTPITFTPSGKYIEFFDGECTIFPSRTQRDWAKFERFWDKPKVEKFNPKTLQPFDRVLCRDSKRNTWDADIFSYKTDSEALSYHCIGDAYKYCIPYNDETKYLVGTTDECPEFYKWWE